MCASQATIRQITRTLLTCWPKQDPISSLLDEQIFFFNVGKAWNQGLTMTLKKQTFHLKCTIQFGRKITGLGVPGFPLRHPLKFPEHVMPTGLECCLGDRVYVFEIWLEGQHSDFFVSPLLPSLWPRPRESGKGREESNVLGTAEEK